MILKKIMNRIRIWYAKKLALYLSDLLPQNSKILDFGCDDGVTSLNLLKLRPDLEIIGLDVQKNRNCKIERIIYDGLTIPFSDNTFDAVISIEVLHHCKDQNKIIDEIYRVSKSLIIIKDQIYNSKNSQKLLKLVDWLTNIFSQYNIKCPYNFLNLKEWENIFSNKNFIYKKIYFNYPIFKRYNIFFIIKKRVNLFKKISIEKHLLNQNSLVK